MKYCWLFQANSNDKGSLKCEKKINYMNVVILVDLRMEFEVILIRKGKTKKLK